MSYLVVMENAVIVPADPRSNNKVKYRCDKVQVYNSFTKKEVKEEKWYNLSEDYVHRTFHERS